MTDPDARSRGLPKAIGSGVFRVRFGLGLMIALLAIEWIAPAPLFGPGHRLTHGSALVLVVLGLALRAWASGCAGTHTREGNMNAPQLVTGGPFAHVRNPIYCGSVILSAGMVLLIGDVRALVVAALTLTVLFLAIVPAEEAFLLRRFGEDYRRYCAAVPRWMPRRRAWPGRHPATFRWRAAEGETLVAAALLLIYGALLIEEYIDRLGFP